MPPSNAPAPQIQYAAINFESRRERELIDQNPSSWRIMIATYTLQGVFFEMELCQKSYGFERIK